MHASHPALMLVLILGGCASAPVQPPEPAEGEHALVVNIRGLDCCEGALRVALYNSVNHWLDDHGMVRGQVAPVLGTEQVVEFAGLPAGDYAVALYQDINANARIDRFLGIVPREPYGFSGNPGGFGRPSFEAAKISLTDQTEITIDMRPPPF